MKLLATIPAIATALLIGTPVIGAQAIGNQGSLKPPNNSNVVWLILTHGVYGVRWGNAANSDSTSIVAISMETMKGCKAGREKWAGTPSKYRKGFREFQCIESR